MKCHAGYIFVTVISVILCLSCGNDADVAKHLDDAESLMDSDACAALGILESVDSSALDSRRLRARYALLYSMALDKNYVDTTDIGILMPALDYYCSYGKDVRSKMLSYYYLGRIHENSGDIPNAMLSYLKAEECAVNCDDSRYLGLIYRSMADVNNYTFNAEEELRYAKLAFECFSELEDTVYADYALLGLATAYNNIHNYEECIRYCVMAIDRAKQNQDQVLLSDTYRMYADVLIKSRKNSEEQASELLSEILAMGFSLSVKDCGRLAYCNALLGNDAAADEMLGLAEKIAGKGGRYNVFGPKYWIEKHRGNYSAALSAFESEVSIQDSILRDALRQSSIVTQRNYFRQMSEYEKYRFRVAKTVMISGAVFAVFVVVIIIVVTLYRSRRREDEISGYITLLDVSDRQIKELSSEISEFSHKISHLYQAKFDMIDNICRKYYEHSDENTRRSVVYREVENLIGRLSSTDDEYMLLESILDKYKDDIMHKLRADSALKLKPDDIRLLGYWFAGFSSSMMSLLLNKPISVIYNMRSRIKSRIEHSNSEYKDIYLNLLVK